MTNTTAFKAYDIRGEIGVNFDETIVYKIGRAYAQWLKPKRVVVGGDARKTSALFKAALTKGLREEGVDVLDLGMCGTEEIYYATISLELDGGIEITASHNPINFNGMKLVREKARPISGDTGLNEIRNSVAENNFTEKPLAGSYQTISNRDIYVEHLFSYFAADKLKPLKIVINAGNGAAGPTLDAIERKLKERQSPIEFIKVNHEPDDTFPNGIPNPMLLENRKDTRDAVLKHKADLGIAWDGDFDRCFFFDEHGEFIEGYYIVGLLANMFLLNHPNEKIIHDPRLTWNTISLVEQFGGTPIESKTGHAFIKERMRKENAIYGGEMSAHHYFRDFGYCDSGMIPWLLVIELLSRKSATLSELVEKRMALFPVSGEINIKVNDVAKILVDIENTYQESAISISKIDGLTMIFSDWRFNLRGSNTEPVLRLNVEAKNLKDRMETETNKLLSHIKNNKF